MHLPFLCSRCQRKYLTLYTTYAQLLLFFFAHNCTSTRNKSVKEPVVLVEVLMDLYTQFLFTFCPTSYLLILHTHTLLYFNFNIIASLHLFCMLSFYHGFYLTNNYYTFACIIYKAL